MRSSLMDGEARLLLWQRVREFAVPPSMIETATARRLRGDWAGAGAAAHFDVDVDPRAALRAHGRELAARLRDDLRHLAPDLLRWHLPRVAPDGLLRPGLTISLARYRPTVHLIARTAPAWADAGQRVSLALWDGRGARHPDRRFRLDLHRHLWDVRHAGELRERAGREAAGPAGGAEHRWPAEAALLRQAEGRPDDPVIVRMGARRRMTVTGGPAGDHRSPGLVLPDAATWVLPDLELLGAGLIDPGRLHPLVAAALIPGHRPAERAGAAPGPRLVECRGARHRIGLVAGALAPLDHDPEELRREEMLVALGGPPLPCLRAVDDAIRRPESIDGIRARLDHGDVAGALAVVEELLGPEVLLRSGALRDELATAAALRVTYGLYRNGMTGHGPYKKTSTTKVIY